MKYDYLSIALEWPVVRRSLIMSGVVGFVLMMINHGMCIYMNKFTPSCFWQCVVTFFVPYAVSTISSVLAAAASPK